VPTSSEETEDEVTEDDEIEVPRADEIKVPRADRHSLVSVKRVRVTEPWLFKLPRLVSESENYPITARVTLGRASVFIDFEKETNTFRIAADSLSEDFEGTTNDIDITLVDSLGVKSRHHYTLRLEIVSDADGAEEIPEEEKNAKLLAEVDRVKTWFSPDQLSEQQNFEEKAEEEEIDSELTGRIAEPMGHTGQMTLLFSEPLFRFQSKARPDTSTLSIRVKRNEQFDEEYYEHIDTNINWNCTAFNTSSLDF